MKEITRNSVLEVNNEKPRTKCFGNNSGVQKKKKKSNSTFSVKIESVKKIFEAQTGLLFEETRKFGNYWRYLDAEEIEKVEKWEQAQGTLVYVHDCLSLSLALDFNFTKHRGDVQTKCVPVAPTECVPVAPTRTHLGLLEGNAKSGTNSNAIKELAEAISQSITKLPFYKDANFVCAVPPSPEKNFDLPTEIVKQVSVTVKKPDITGGFTFSNEKKSLKNTGYEKKWDTLERAKLAFQSENNIDIRDKTIILIDDKYQSGITIQFVAMKLQQAGAREVYGLCVVKTLSNSDNSRGKNQKSSAEHGN